MRLMDIVSDCCEDVTAKSYLKCMIVYFIVPYYCEEKINILYRLSVFMRKKNIRFLMKVFEYKLLKKFNCHLSGESEISKGLHLPHPTGIIIGSGVRAGENLTIYQNVTLGQNNGGYPVIGDNVIIYPGSKIVGDIVIGNNVIIGANSVVIHDVEDGAVVAGVPAVKIGKKKMHF